MPKEVICEPIEIKGSMTRHEIVQKVVNTFINTEHEQRGRGVKFWYPVEQLPSSLEILPKGARLFVFRPGGLQKWNFDFKVNVTPELGLGKGTHDAIASDLKNKKQENPQEFEKLIEAMKEIYSGSENDVDQVLTKYPDLRVSFQTGAQIEVLLKVLKWMFIMEDIVYWNYDGRAKLYNFLKEV
ncbi:MAG: hypothetical protein PHN78_02015 [Dehalococcoidales bacterium]|nr:hypothetical protein [Dehalococcoidales bacterium]